MAGPGAPADHAHPLSPARTPLSTDCPDNRPRAFPTTGRGARECDPADHGAQGNHEVRLYLRAEPHDDIAVAEVTLPGSWHDHVLTTSLRKSSTRNELGNPGRASPSKS